MNRRPPLNCDEAVARLDDYLDRELSAEEMVLVHDHLETCAHCAEAFVFEARVLDELKRKLRRIDLPGALIDKVRAIVATAGD